MRYVRTITALVVFLGWCSGTAWADYVDPPPWQTNPYYTHQSWDFNTNANPLSPDGGYTNPYGTPQAQLINGTWVQYAPYYPYGDRTGWWFFSGPHTKEDVLARITIPNTPHPELIKEIWLQATLQTNLTNFEDDFDLRVYPNGQEPYVRTTDVQVEILDQNLGLARATVRFVLDPQPGLEVVEIRANMTASQFFAVDQLDIDTRCLGIPEPASVVLGLLAAPALLLFWRRKR